MSWLREDGYQHQIKVLVARTQTLTRPCFGTALPSRAVPRIVEVVPIDTCPLEPSIGDISISEHIHDGLAGVMIIFGKFNEGRCSRCVTVLDTQGW